ncbi:MAG: hypothetical protein AAGG44_06375 [Planctomycetota bacterium]
MRFNWLKSSNKPDGQSAASNAAHAGTQSDAADGAEAATQSLRRDALDWAGALADRRPVLGRLRSWGLRKWDSQWHAYYEKAKELATSGINVPLLAGLGFLFLGLLLVLVSVKDPWYQVPVRLKAAASVDQSDKLPTRRVPDKLEAEITTSKFEFPCKAIIVVSITATAVYVVRAKLSAVARAHALGTLSAICLTVGLAFAHLVIVDDPEVSHLGAWMFMQHDGLSWYGGDTYTSREYEIPGGAYDILMKDPPKFLAAITPPYVNFDIATLGDFLTWAGLCHAFWIFMGKGWASMMMGALLLMVGVLCTRKPGQTRGLSNDIVLWVLVRAALILIPWIGIVTARSLYVATKLASAQEFYEAGEHAKALETMRVYRRYMPCLAYDSGLMVQEGILENLLHIESDRARFAEAFMLESNGYPEQSQRMYLELMDSKEQCVAREAARYVLRRAIIHYNSGEESVALKLVERFRLEYPCMPKASYLRLLLAVRADDIVMAQHCLQEIYASVAPVGMPESRGYRTSGHQHLAQLAFDLGDLVETRRQVVYRMEQQPK